MKSVPARGEGCCGALLHHLGKEAGALAQVRHNVDLWSVEIERHGLDAILITASGCGTMIKDYGFLLRNDPAYAAKAVRVSALAKDVTEFLGALDLPEPLNPQGATLAYHSACSMQHGQRIDALPKQLLTQAGFKVRDIPEGHLCCGSAGTYNILEPEIALRLRDRKIANILATAPDLIATGNIGCMAQIASGTSIPVLHTIELLDFAYGGIKPQGSALKREPLSLFLFPGRRLREQIRVPKRRPAECCNKSAVTGQIIRAEPGRERVRSLREKASPAAPDDTGTFPEDEMRLAPAG